MECGSPPQADYRFLRRKHGLRTPKIIRFASFSAAPQDRKGKEIPIGKPRHVHFGQNSMDMVN